MWTAKEAGPVSTRWMSFVVRDDVVGKSCVGGNDVWERRGQKREFATS